jgi:hypothetical protein
MQNYNKAHKLKFKATKKQQKMLRQLDGDPIGLANNKKNKGIFRRIINTTARKIRKILVKKGRARNVENGEPILLRSAHLKNLQRNLRRLIWHQLETLDL